MGVIYPRKHNPQAMEPKELGMELLVTAIVSEASKDFRKACSTLRFWPDSKRANALLNDVSSFFRSEWFTVLTGLNGEYVLRKLKEEFPEVFQRKKDPRGRGNLTGPAEKKSGQEDDGRRGA